MKKEPLEQTVLVPPGTELNYGFHEDGDSIITIGWTELIVKGPQKNGALPVQINGEDQTFFFHQPEPAAT